MKLIVKIAVTGAAFWLVSWLLSGISIGDPDDGPLQWAVTLGGIAVIFGLVNAVLKPIIQALGCGFYILTLGLFSLVVNAGLFMLVAWLARLLGLEFSVANFWWAMLGALLVAVTTWVVNLVLPDRVAAN